MKKLIRLFLFVGAFMGLLLQTAAYAAGPSVPVAATQSMEMNAECMEMMPQQESKDKSCNGLTLKCIAAMGCITMVSLPADASPELVRHAASSQAFWVSSPMFVGGELAPEVHPPSLLS